MENLPDEIVVMILRYLGVRDLLRCGLVCRRWQRLASDESLWKFLSLNFVRIPLRTLAKIIKRGVRELSLKNSVISDPKSWARIFSPPTYRSQIQVLNLSRASISGEGILRFCRWLPGSLKINIQSFLHVCPGLRCLLKPMYELRELNVEGCRLNLCCADIAKNSHLKVLDMSYCRNTDTRGFEMILKRCQRLENLNLNLMNLNRKNLATLSCEIPTSVRRLDLRDCSLMFTDTHLSNIIKLCPNLTHLDISYNRSLSKAAAQATSTLSHLEELQNYQYDSDSEQSDDDLDPFADILEYMSDSSSTSNFSSSDSDTSGSSDWSFFDSEDDDFFIYPH